MLFSKRVICSILPEVDFGGLVALLDVYVLGWERCEIAQTNTLLAAVFSQP